MPQVKFNIVTPESDTRAARYVAEALALGLPEIDGDELPVLNVVANGPSAAGAELGGWTLALNGALGLFPADAPPSMWAAMDSQSLVADFLSGPLSPQTTFLVNSRCDPAVFGRLAGHDVRLWHLGDMELQGKRQVPSALSITLCALMLMRRLGWRRMDVWGWDCCFSPEGAHHANGCGSIATQLWEVALEDRSFITTASWLAEAEVAGMVLTALEWSGAEIAIHGDGLVQHAASIMKQGREAQIVVVREIKAAA